MHPDKTEFIGVDVGAAKVGLARGSSLAKIAEPLKTVTAKDAVNQLAVIASEDNVGGIVVGLPRNLSSQDTAQTKYVRTWVKSLKSSLALPLYWQDEALTSQSVASVALKTHDEHAMAAAIILQDFLDTPESERVRC